MSWVATVAGTISASAIVHCSLAYREMRFAVGYWSEMVLEGGLWVRSGQRGERGRGKRREDEAFAIPRELKMERKHLGRGVKGTREEMNRGHCPALHKKDGSSEWSSCVDSFFVSLKTKNFQVQPSKCTSSHLMLKPLNTRVRWYWSRKRRWWTRKCAHAQSCNYIPPTRKIRRHTGVINTHACDTNTHVSNKHACFIRTNPYACDKSTRTHTNSQTRDTHTWHEHTHTHT